MAEKPARAGKAARAARAAKAGKAGKLERAANPGKAGAGVDEKRKKRREAVAAANKVTVILETDVRRNLTAQARDAGMDLVPFMVKLLEGQILANAPKGDQLATRLKAKRAVLDRAVDVTRTTVEAGGFDEHLILNVMKKASQDAEFNALYEQAIGATEDKPARNARAALNQQMGRLIKRAAGARSKRDEGGKIMRAQVQDEIITSYTLLDKAA